MVVEREWQKIPTTEAEIHAAAMDILTEALGYFNFRPPGDLAAFVRRELLTNP